jgi:hypothetical protein
VSAFHEFMNEAVRHWRLDNYHREQMRLARHDLDGVEHVERIRAGVRDYQAGGV